LRILDLNIENCKYDDILDNSILNITSRKLFNFSYVNVHVALMARKNASLQNDLKQFSTLYSDGIGMYWASKYLYGKSGLSERINGTDLYYKILNLAQKNNYKIFFFGGGEKAAAFLIERLKKKYPNLLTGGVIQRDLTLDESILQKINQSNSDILFLGLGTPDQEKWIASFGKKCNIPIQISVGSGIDFLAGVYKRAPKLLQLIGLEWLFRLLLEPKRLWKRYLIGIPTFVILIFKQKLSEKNQL
jgi:N-acetylglucosaminyldiphosphoundecaprenol N-acetyl-beta-D-mannosaminyltransferase